MFTTQVWDPWASPSRRGWTTLVSFTLQVAGVAVLLAVPLIYTGAPPQFDSVRRIFVPLPPAGSAPPSSPPQGAMTHSNSNLSHGVLIVPSSIPRTVATVDDEGIAPSVFAEGIYGGTGRADARNSVINSFSDIAQPFVPKPPVPVSRPPRISAMMEGFLVHKVEPVYPPLARAARVQGTVELQAIISKQGTIERLQVLRGHPLLVKAAVDAVQQWRYRPYLLNGEAVEVETHVTVNFSLLGG